MVAKLAAANLVLQSRLDRRRSGDEYCNLKELAARMGLPYSTVRAMRSAGMPLEAGKVTVKEAKKWLRSHPDFRPGLASRFWRRQEPGPELDGIDDKCRELWHLHD